MTEHERSLMGELRAESLKLALYRPQDGCYDHHGREIVRPIEDVLADADAIAAWLSAEMSA